MEVNYTYAKFRKEFGRQCRFSDHGPTMVINVMPNPSLDEQWILKNPVNQSTNKSVHWSAHEANTEVVDFADRGILHTEGGWPKDVNIDDPEQVVRFRKKAEKDETYLESVMKMSLVAEHAINQNNAIDIYQSYFTDPSCRKEETLIPSFQTVAVMSDPCDPIRPVQHLSWSPEDNLVAVSYADMAFQAANPANSPDSYIFNLESNTPYFSIESPNPIVTLEFNHRDAQCLAGGLMNGQVAYWDIRKGSENVAISNLRHGHRDPVKSLYWIHSKTSTEFYTGSSDGQVMWWDTRKLTEPTEVLILDLSVNENSDEPEWSRQARTHGVTCMDYDSSIPIRFMIGTETGLVFNGNRKGKTVLEKVSGIYNCHHGPVYSAQRNPVYSKNFLTVGDWQVRIWSEDIKDSPIMWTKHHDVRLTDGAWSETKPSVFYTTRADGCLECWDLLQKQNEPILTIKIADKELKCIKCHEDGALLAVGDECGKTYVVEMNDWFVVPGKTDKALLMAMFDRETKREKIIESKLRELRLKAKTSAKPDTETNQEKHALLVEAETRLIADAEKEFDELVAKLNKKLTNDDEDELGREIADELQDRTVDQ